MTYPNLSAEMARKEISRQDLANALGVNICTITPKLNNVKRIKLCEAQEIQKRFFTEFSISYLFETASN